MLHWAKYLPNQECCLQEYEATYFIYITTFLRISFAAFFREVKEAGSFYSLASMYINNEEPSYSRRPYS